MLADLDERAWDWFEPEQCAALAASVVERVREALLVPSVRASLGQRDAPPLPLGVFPEDLALSTRITNVLLRAGFATGTPSSVAWTVGDLMELRGIGAKGLVELLVALEAPPAMDRPRSPAHRDHAPPVAAGAPSETERLLGGLTINEAMRLGAWCRRESATLSPSIEHKRLPPIPVDTHLNDLDLRRRTSEALRRAGHANVGVWLHDATIGEILRVPLLGRIGVADLLRAVTQFMQQPAPRADITALADAIAGCALAETLRPDDPRVRDAARGLCHVGETVGMAARRLVGRSRDPADVERLAACLRQVAAVLDHLGRQPVENELLELAVAVSDVRQGAIYARYAGWDGRGGAVLQAVGDEFRITRERVRQICVKVEKRLGGARPVAPVLARCLERLQDLAPDWADDLAASLEQEGLTRQRFDVQVLIHAATLMGLSSALLVRMVAGRPRLCHSQDPTDTSFDESARMVHHAARRAIESLGVARIDDVLATASVDLGMALERSFVEDVLGHERGFSWLDQEAGWFWNRDVSRNRLLNQIEKVMSVAGSLDVGELGSAVARHYRMEGRAPPQHVLAELCRQLPGYRVEGSVVRAELLIEPGDALADTELTFYQILASSGSIMSRADLEAACRQQGMNRATFYVYLGNSPILTCPRRGVYALVGAASPPDQLRALVVRPVRSRVIMDSGLSTDGKAWIVYRPSENMVTSGAFSLPSGLKPMIQGDFPLFTESGAQVGTIRCRDSGQWGLRPFFHRHRCTPEDYFALVFDLERHEAIAVLGDQAHVARFTTASLNGSGRVSDLLTGHAENA